MAKYESEGTWFEKKEHKTYPRLPDKILDMFYRRPTKESIIKRIENALKLNSVRIHHGYGNISYNDYIALRDTMIIVLDELKVMD